MSEVIIKGDALDCEDIVSRIKDIFKISSPLEQKQFIAILQELADKGYSQTLEQMYLVDFKEVPVSIDRFLTDPYYLGKTNDCGKQIYPGWWEVYNSVFDNTRDIYEVVLSGATRIGKTSTAVSMMAYMTYLLMCYRNPQKYFGLKEVSRATIAFANLTKDLAEGVSFREYNDTLKRSPWFNEHGAFSRSATKPIYIPEGNQIELVAASDAAHVLGMQLWACILDECNFARAGVKDINISKQHMKSMYDTANARITGTFKLEGKIYGKMFTCSSKNTDNDYLSDHIEQQLNAGNTHMYLFDKPQWEVLPSYRFGKEKFHVTVGDRYKRGFVVPKENDDEAHLQAYRDEGFKVLEVPEDYRPNFIADYDIALRDIAGISVVGAMGFITQEMITPNVTSDRANPFYQDYYEIGVHDSKTIEDLFHLEVVPNNYKSLPMYIHVDFAETSDHIGISGVIQDGTKNVYDIQTERKVMMPFYRQIFQVAIGAPRGDRMSFQKVINFIVWLRKNGFYVRMVTTDQYQSSYVLENLNQQGFETNKVSVDRTEDPYITLRSLLTDQRIELIKHDLQEVELINLQRTNNTIDHKPQSACFTGDTKIQLVDGRSLTIEELLIEQQYKTNWVYTINESTKLIEPKPIENVFQTKLTKDLIKVTLDNDEIIYCTPDHRFMLRDGSYEIAANLSSGDSLMPLYTKVSDKGLDGYRLYYEPMEDEWHYEHRRFCSADRSSDKPIVHHCNYNKLDNTPTNLLRVTRSEHKRIHNNSTLDYSKVSSSLRRWYKNNKESEAFKSRHHKKSVTLIINRYYKKTGKYLSASEAESFVGVGLREAARLDSRIHDIELLFNIDWKTITGRDHITLGCRLSAVINATEYKYSVHWADLSDREKVDYYNKYRIDKLFDTLRRCISSSLDVVIRDHNISSKPTKRIKTITIFKPNELRINWIEHLFGVDWDNLSFAEKQLASRRLTRLLDTGEYYPLDIKLGEYAPKHSHIIKSLSLYGSNKDIRFRNIEEYYGIHMEDISPKQRSGYARKYNNVCRGKLTKEEILKRRIRNIESTYNICWKDLDVAGRSKYCLQYHNLTNLSDKESHYSAVRSAISQRSWYTDGINNRYIKQGDKIPEGYYKGRVLSKESIEKRKATLKNLSPEEKATRSKRYSLQNSQRIWITNGTVDKYINNNAPIPEGFVRGRSKHGKNHKVKSVERVSHPCRVYDLTIKDNPNFALSAGVFVHNSKSEVPSLANGYNSKGIGKDSSDALCGACYALVKYGDQVRPSSQNIIGAISSVNGGRGYAKRPNGRPQYIPGFGQFGSQYRRW